MGKSIARASARSPAVPGDALATRLHSNAIHLLRRLRGEDVHSGLTGPRLSALSVVVFGGPVTLGDLAAAEQVRPPTMTHLVEALRRQGLVKRTIDPADRRVIRVVATPKGTALLMEGRDRRVRRLADPLRLLSPEERDVLERASTILERVLRDLT
jgi:DNA-binding MarR family transcriptional regulator